MDVHLRIVGGFEAGKIVPEENTGNSQNNERGKKYPTLVGALRSDKPKLAGQLKRRVSCAAFALYVWPARWIRCLILFSHTHFPSTYSAKPDSATPIALARDIFARLWL